MMIAKKPKVKKSYKQKAYLDRFPYNLVNSGNLEEYFQTLTDFKFLAKKINHPELGVQALIADYDLVDDPPQPPLKRGENQPPQPFLERGENISLNPEKVKTLKRIQGALRLSAHVLAKDKTQLVEQLWGRMQGFDVPEIQQLLSQAKQSKTTWLRPLSASLTPPGGRLLRTLSGHSSLVNAVAVTGDGTRAISGSFDNTLKVWNLETGEELFTLQGHSDRVNAVAVTADGKRALSGSEDNTLKLWNLETGEQLFTLHSHSSSVRAVAVTADGKRALSGSGDNTLKLWNLETGEVIASFTGDSPIICCAVAPDGVTIVAGEASGQVHFLLIENSNL